MKPGRFPALKSAVSLSLLLAGAVMADIAPVLESYRNSEDKRVLVACHRAGYRVKGGKDLPENSLPAIRESIRAGADILEIDLMMTSDGELVLMHDATLDRTTNGRGKVQDKTLAEIKKLRLRLPNRRVTQERVPTFRETMQAVKGKVLVNLDKLPVTNRKKMDAAMKVLRDTGTVNHAIFKQGVKDVPPEKIRQALEYYPDPEKIHFMPVIANATAKNVVAVLDAYRPESIEIVFKEDPVGMLSPEVLAAAKRHGTRLWINTLWASLNAGHDDARALAGDPAGSWGWVVERGAAIIQTDHRDPLLRYLEGIGRRQLAK